MKMSRRQYIKAHAAGVAASVAGISLPAAAANIVTESEKTRLTWSKAPCRFCGTGCSVMVATKSGRVVATHGDIKSEVNKGLNCVKGYFLSKIMYGRDRVTSPLLRMKNGKYHKEGTFTEVSWDRAFDEMEVQFKKNLEGERSHRGGYVRIGPVDGVGRLRRFEAHEGGFPIQQHRP